MELVQRKYMQAEAVALRQSQYLLVPVVMHFLGLQGREEEYTYYFTTEDVSELAAAVSKVKAAGVSSEQDILEVLVNHLSYFAYASCNDAVMLQGDMCSSQTSGLNACCWLQTDLVYTVLSCFASQRTSCQSVDMSTIVRLTRNCV